MAIIDMSGEWLNDSYISLYEACKILSTNKTNIMNDVSKSIIHSYRDGETRRHYIKKSELASFINHTKWIEDNFYLKGYIQSHYNITRQLIDAFLEKNFCEGLCSFLKDKNLRIPKTIAESMVQQIKMRYMPENYMESYKVREVLDICEKTFNRLNDMGLLGDSFYGLNQDGRVVRAYNREIVESYKEKCLKEKEYVSSNGYLNYKEAIEIFPPAFRNSSTIQKLFASRVFDDFYIVQYPFEEYRVYVSKDSLQRYIDKNKYRYTPLDGDPLEVFNQLMDTVVVPECMLNTASAFKDYISDFIMNSSSVEKNLRHHASSAVKLLTRCTQILVKELKDYSDPEIKLLLKSPMLVRLADKVILVSFIRYLQTVSACRYKEDYSYKQFNLPKEEDTLPLETLVAYYRYAKDTNKHLARAIDNRKYANCWLYVAFHMCNAWRHSDVLSLPNIDLKSIGVQSFDYFIYNQLDITQANRVMAQVNKSKIVDLIVQKTGFKKNFFVSKNIVIPLAIAYVISELHRQKENDDKVINFKNKYNTPNMHHWRIFFVDSMELAPFSSMKANRALIEHLFYDVVGKKGTAHLAYDLARSLRNHKINPLKMDTTLSQTTKIYISQTSGDGPLDWTVLELFERNEFGFLYYLILRGAFEGEEGDYLPISFETEMIKALQERYPPLALEQMAEYLNTLNAQKESLAYEIATTPSIKLKETLSRLYAGEQPSKQTDVQCYAYPNCPYTTNMNCYGCHLAIPRAGALQSITDMISLKIGNVKDETNYPNILKDMSVLISLMDKLEEARIDFGKEFVEGYIDLKQLQLDYDEAIGKLVRHTRYYLEEQADGN